MPEHYSASQLGATKALFDAMNDWINSRDDVTLIGGWAVFSLVTQNHAMQSRDVDIIIHSDAALKDLCERMPAWNLAWRTSGRKRFPDAHFRDEDPLVFRLDVFVSGSIALATKLFGRFVAVKQCPHVGLPTVAWMVQDKLETIPLRNNDDAEDKRAKDFMDTYNLIFNNSSRDLPLDLANQIGREIRIKARPFLKSAIDNRPEYNDEYALIGYWLES